MAVRAAIGCVALLHALPASAQLRIVDYNIAQNYDIASDPGGLDTIFAAIGAEVRNGFARPIDVLAVQETDTDGSDAVLLAGILNSVFGVSTYMAAPAPGNAVSGGNGLPGMVYNSASVSLVGTLAFGDTGSGPSQQPRSTLRYQLRPAGYSSTADFYLYNSHYKAEDNSADQQRRLIEAASIRDNSDALGEGAHALYVGDFNVYRDDEPMYVELLAAGAGQAFDPVNRPGNWSTPSQAEGLKDVHTQSPATVEAFTGQVLAGMDDRFDFQLITGELQDGEGMSYLTSSYHTFGNNGTHAVNGAITTGTGAAANVLTALAQSSDHLPVVADYQLPAKMQVQVASIPTNVAVGAAVGVNVMVENIVNAIAAIGGDELDYTLSVSGDLLGGAMGMDVALRGGNTHQVTLNTTTTGTKSGTISVTASSQGAANALFNFPVSFVVGGSGTPTRVAIARDDFDSPLNLNSFSQTPAAGAFASTQDGFQRFQVGVSPSIPNDLMDDSTTTFPADQWGIINRGVKADGWFGLADTENPNNLTGDVVATWEFEVGGASALEVSIDIGAMGEFEPGDIFNWTYAIDGGAFAPLFTSSVGAGTAAYMLADGDVFNVTEPLLMTTTENETVQLSNILQTLTSPIMGIGDTLVIRLNAKTNGDDEAYAFDNIVVTGLIAGFDDADFNEDGFVDSDDLTAWKFNFGLAGVAEKEDGDADLDGDVDGADFLVWQQRLSSGGAAAAVAAAVPEPSALWMSLGAGLGVVRRRRAVDSRSAAGR